MQECWIADGHIDSIINYQAGKSDLRKPDGCGHWNIAGAEKAVLASHSCASALNRTLGATPNCPHVFGCLLADI